ncbi:hypothetical protein [Solihabitans fulvus]|uniref:hypothetical protein n=1 Tax=Solihabitans fulvus TaxID=1892852 RepID=UPI001661E732|nr:hypothetical protein [Solihabitans fulvus]
MVTLARLNANCLMAARTPSGSRLAGGWLWPGLPVGGWRGRRGALVTVGGRPIS